MNYWRNITEIYNKQRNKGVHEYGQTLEENQIPDVLARLSYIEEELVDALMYLEWLMDSMRSKPENTPDKKCAICSFKYHSKAISHLPSCNDCKRKNCEYKPEIGNWCRINCQLFVGEEVDG